MSDTLTEKRISERYRILENIGSGGMANVYKAIDEQTQNIVAIKVLKEEHADDADFLRRFELEAKAALKLSHPNIVRSFDVGTDGDTHYIVFEYVQGSTLKDIIREDGPLTPKEAVSVASQILDALEHAHNNGIIHRDVKPQNVMITNQGVAMLTDFGIARDTASTTRTFAGTNVIGSVHYLSPEQARGDQVGPESDIYSCGIMLYEMLTGQVPFGGENSVAIAIKHLQEDIKPPIAVNSRIPRALSDVVIKATAKKIELRYQTAAAMRADLWRALREPHGKFARLETQPPSKDQPAPAKRSHFSVGNIALLVILVLGMFTALFFTVQAMRESKLIDSKDYVIPSFQGKKFSEAKELASLRGFILVESDTRMPSEQYDEGVIISQTPGSGVKGKVGDKITVVVSSGSDHTSVPSFIGMTLQEAMLAAEDASVKLSDPVYMASDLPDGQIFNQDPVAETSVYKNDIINIWISGQQNLNIEMPQLKDQSLDAAIDAVIGRGFEKVLVYPMTPESAAQENMIMKQAPSSGMSVSKNTPVELYVGRTFLGNYAADIAFNVDVKDAEKNVIVTAQLSEKLETVLYSAILPVGDQQSVSFTGYLNVSGEYPVSVYLNGEKIRSSKAVFSMTTK